jgi:hypothetical protein
MDGERGRRQVLHSKARKLMYKGFSHLKRWKAQLVPLSAPPAFVSANGRITGKKNTFRISIPFSGINRVGGLNIWKESEVLVAASM